MTNFLKTANFEILCQSIRLNDTSRALSAVTDIIDKGEINWDDLFERADYHCIKPQLGNLLNKIPAYKIPDKILENLKELNLENAHRQMRNLAEFFQIQQLMDEAGIVAIPFKGFWLAHNFYSNLADRESVDVDLFIDSKDMENIKEIMAKRGYVPEKAVSQLTTNYILSELCEYNFDHFAENIRVFHFEFHWRISLTAYGMDIRLDDLKSHIVTGFIQKKRLQIFSTSANFLLTVMHHGGKDQFLQLKQVLDIAYLINRNDDMDWAWIIGQSRRFNTEHLVYIAVRMATLLSGVSAPEAIKDSVNSKFIRKLADNRIQMMSSPPEKWNSWWHNLQNWNFQIRSRTGRKLKIRLFFYKIRREILPQFVPKKLHHLFLNREIRLK